MTRRTHVGATVLLGLAMVAALVGGCAVDPAAIQEEAASARSPIIGLAAPDFTLKNQDDQPVSLRDARGKWVVLYFYPKDDTPGCTCEATEFTKLLGEFQDANARIHGISADSVASHKAFVEVYKLKLDLLSDPGSEVMKNYGAWVEARLGDKAYWRVIRTTMIIDPEGIVRYHWPEVIPSGHAKRVRERLMQLQADADKPPS